jgi:hypothetical protein
MKFPVDAAQGDVRKALELLGFQVVRKENHIILERANADGTITPLVIPNHRTRGKSGVSREAFLQAYSKV